MYVIVRPPGPDGTRPPPIPTFAFDFEGAQAALFDYVRSPDTDRFLHRGLDTTLRVVLEAMVGSDLTAQHRRVLEFWGDLPLSSITLSSCLEYADWREGQAEPRNWRGTPSPTTVRNELSKMGTIVKRFCEARGISPVPKTYLIQSGDVEGALIKEIDFRRLLLAAEGQVWDRAAGDWRRCPDTGRPFLRDERKRSQLLPMRRLVPFLMWTGSRIEALLRMTWSVGSLQGWIDRATGVLHRSGRYERRTNKRQPPVGLLDELRHLIEEWAREDAAQGTDFVIHKADGTPLRDYWRLFEDLRIAAGLPEGVITKAFRRSCAVWLLEKGLSYEQVAEFLGNSVKIVVRHYDHYEVEFSEAAADAVGSRRY